MIFACQSYYTVKSGCWRRWHYYQTISIDIAHYKDLELDNDHIDKLLFIATTYSDAYNLEDDTDDITIGSTFLSELRRLNIV